MASRAHRFRVRPLIAAGAVILLAGAGATTAYATTSSGGHAYRTATVTRGSVARRLSGTGAIQPVAQAAVAFPIAGTVATVDVAVGAHVAAGQTLATLDASSLQKDLIDKQATLAAANLTLYKALNGESSSTGSGAHTTNTAAASSSASASSSSKSASSSTSSAQQQVLGAQQDVDAALAAVQTALGTASTACGAGSTTKPTPQPKPGPGRTTKQTAAPSSSVPPNATSTTTTTTVAGGSTSTGHGFGTAACSSAQQQLLTQEQGLATAQQTLGRAVSALEQSLGSSTSSTPASGGSNNSNSSSASTASTPSAAQLVADQAAVDAAGAAVLAAQESVEQATITSPLAGVVEAGALRVDESVTASSTTDTIVVAGSGGYEISTTVGVNDIVKLKVGDAATVVPDGANTTLTGKVTWIGAASGSGSSVTYPVVIGLSGSAAGLRSGAMASTSIELAHSATSALTVPTSAVHTTNGLHFVTILAAGKTSTAPVQIGVVGAQLTEITSGLTVGQVVVLADLHAAVPSSNTNSRVANALTGGGGFTGGGFTGGGGGTRLGG